jgi:hypothetical protein
VFNLFRACLIDPANGMLAQGRARLALNLQKRNGRRSSGTGSPPRVFTALDDTISFRHTRLNDQALGHRSGPGHFGHTGVEPGPSGDG